MAKAIWSSNPRLLRRYAHPKKHSYAGWHGSIFAAMLPLKDMAAEDGCHATQAGFLSMIVGEADGAAQFCSCRFQ